MVMIIFELIGIVLVIYAIFYVLTLCFIDCDLRLAFYEIFGKSPARLKGNVVFITGASSGIGEHTAYALAKYGTKLVLNARRKAELERVRNECIAKSNGQLKDDDIFLIPADITDISSHQRIFNEAIAHFGTVDILLNNAGRSQRALFENTEIGVDHQMFDLNVFAVINLSRIAINYFKQKGCDGHVAVISSLAALFGLPYCASYTAAKHSIHGYFDALRAEKHGSNLTVSLLCPGPTQTNVLSESFTEKFGEVRKFGIPAEPENRMSSKRCGQLCAVALANKIDECWMGRFPTMLFIYWVVYFPLIYNYAMKILGPTKFFKPVASRN